MNGITRALAVSVSLFSTGAFAGVVPPSAAVPVADLEAFAGLFPGALDSISPSGDPATEGSAIQQTLTVMPGEMVAIDFLFLTNEGPEGADDDVIDFAFGAVSIPFLGISELITSVDDPLGPSSTPFSEESASGFDTFAVMVPGGGQPVEVTVTFGVVDVDDDVVDSGLLLDNAVAVNGVNTSFETGDFTGWETIGDVSIVDAGFGASPTDGMYQALLTTAGPTVVPVPAAAWLLGSGILGLAGLARRR